MNTATTTETIRDASGFAVFSHGDSGAVHVMAHRLLDSKRIALGHRLLGEWLDRRAGSGSDWVHLQFHMCVFELALNRWDSACHRFTRHILPAATLSGDALTDAPALLWRLALTAPRPIELPWDAVRATALARLHLPADPYVELHHLLALAGAGDTASLDRWLESRALMPRADRSRIVEGMAVALRNFASGAFHHAALLLDELAPQVPTIGGSRAQNELFHEIARAAWNRAGHSVMAAA